MRVVADRHAFPASSADHQPLQQRRTFACRSTTSLGTPSDRITFHSLEVRLVLLPGNVTGMHVAQQNPFLAWHQTRAHFVIRQTTLFGATEDEGAGIARVVNDLPRTTVQQLGPNQLAFVDTAT